MANTAHFALVFLPSLLVPACVQTPIEANSAVPTKVHKVGDFTPIDIRGWTRQESVPNDMVYYNKSLGTNHMNMIFSWERNIKDGPERIARYRSLIKAGKTMFTPPHKPTKTFRVTSEQNISLNGIPAVKHTMVTNTPDRIAHSTTVQFAYKGRFYTLNSGINFPRPSIAPQAQAAFDQGWALLTKSIKASK